MAKSEHLEALFEKFKERSNCKLSQDQFDTLVVFFPSLLVIMSDGVVDKEEWVFVKHLAKFMSNTFKDEMPDEREREDLSNDYFDNLKYLIENLDRWENRFLDTLKAYLEEHEEVKETVLDTLYLFAEASDGESDSEAIRIKSLRKELKLDD